MSSPAAGVSGGEEEDRGGGPGSFTGIWLVLYASGYRTLVVRAAPAVACAIWSFSGQQSVPKVVDAISFKQLLVLLV